MRVRASPSRTNFVLDETALPETSRQWRGPADRCLPSAHELVICPQVAVPEIVDPTVAKLESGTTRVVIGTAPRLHWVLRLRCHSFLLRIDFLMFC